MDRFNLALERLRHDADTLEQVWRDNQDVAASAVEPPMKKERPTTLELVVWFLGFGLACATLGLFVFIRSL